MSIETRVLGEDGQWVTRLMDINQIISRNRENDGSETGEDDDIAVNVPIVGLLTRTLFQSPMFNCILPARIRSRAKNDVVFVGEDFIIVKELMLDGHLRHVATKNDFGCRIRAARVFGGDIAPSDDSYVKAESEQIELLPPHLLVLTLTSQEMLFIFAREASDGSVSFHQIPVPLPAHRSFLDLPGKHLAVDPKARALAIAACDNMVLFYTAKTRERMQNEYQNHDQNLWTPVLEERALNVAGTIVRMEFLYPMPGDDAHIILVLIVVRSGKSRICCYDWDCLIGLKSLALRQQQPLLKCTFPIAERPGTMI